MIRTDPTRRPVPQARTRGAGQRGVTLIELMLTLAVLGVLVSLAAPFLQDMVRNWRMSSQVNELLSDFAAARGQAAATATVVTVCASSDGASCTGNWSQGRIMFTDADGDATVDAGDQILRISPAISASNTLAVANLVTAGRVQFRPTGMASGVTGAGGTFKLCDSRVGAFGRTVTVAPMGRASITTVNCP